jgi:hypothetical protein
MNIFMRGDQAVPIIIAKRRVMKEPRIEKRRRFVGFKKGLGTLLYKAIDSVLECFWDVEKEVLDAGESDVIHYAIDVSDTPGAASPELVVTRLVGRARPGCGVYCEVISPIREESAAVEQPHAPLQKESNARMVQPKMKRPSQPPRNVNDEDDDLPANIVT